MAGIAYVLTGGMASAELLMLCLLHDGAEQHVGDAPATAKWDYPFFAGALKQAELHALERLAMYAHQKVFAEASENDFLILKWADMIDLCLKCIDEIELGNSSMRRILGTGIGYLKGLQYPQGVAETVIYEILDYLEVKHGE